MTGASFRRFLVRPIAGFSVVAIASTNASLPVMAQLPNLQPPPAPPTQNVPNVNRAPTETAYTLGGGDRIRLDIFDVPEYSGEYQVLVDGTLNLPIVGSVEVEGLTIRQATDKISNLYARFVKRPVLTVSLLLPRPVKLSVAGEVTRPGSYTVPLTEGRTFPTVTQALQLAGGITQVANVRSVQIRRRGAPGRQQQFSVDLFDLLRNGDLSQDISLRDGDTIFIPTTTTLNSAENRLLADATFASQPNVPLKIIVVGEVLRPGPYTVTSGNVVQNPAGVTGPSALPGGAGNVVGDRPTVTRAIQLAGGITPSADIRRVEIRRPTRTGAEQLIAVDLWQLLQGGDLAQDAILQEGDTIAIPTATNIDPAEAPQIAAASFSPNLIRVNVVGEVARPGSVEVPPNTPLNQALLAAGGFNNRARKSRVDLIRLNPNGTVSKRTIDINLAQGINDQSNPILRNNDVVVINRSGLASVSDTLGTILSPVGSIFTFFNFFRIFQ